jgi:hypothetical protein
MVRVQRLIPKGRWERQWVDLELPELKPGDSVEVHFWNAGSQTELRVRDLEGGGCGESAFAFGYGG